MGGKDMKEKYMIHDTALCMYCNNCFVSCKDEYVENDWPPYQAPMPRHGHKWINIERRERGQGDRIDVAYRPTPCMQCENAACEKAGDFVSRREDGIVTFDLIAGKGKDITASCPYGSIWWNEEEHLSQKCDFCAHLLDDPSWEPGIPRCVHTCPTGALRFLEEEPEDFEKRIEAEGLTAYKEELGSKPHVWYKNLYRFTKNFIAGQLLKDGDVAPDILVTLTWDNGKEELTTDIFGEFKFDGLCDGDYKISANGKELANVQIAGASINAGDFDI